MRHSVTPITADRPGMTDDPIQGLEIPMFKDTRYFTVFGNAYVPEHHTNGYRFDVDPTVRSRRTGAAAWLVLCTLVAGISVFAAQIALLTGAHF
jgi:hypothetical protein